MQEYDSSTAANIADNDKARSVTVPAASRLSGLDDGDGSGQKLWLENKRHRLGKVTTGRGRSTKLNNKRKREDSQHIERGNLKIDSRACSTLSPTSNAQPHHLYGPQGLAGRTLNGLVVKASACRAVDLD